MIFYKKIIFQLIISTVTALTDKWEIWPASGISKIAKARRCFWKFQFVLTYIFWNLDRFNLHHFVAIIVNILFLLKILLIHTAK